MRSPDVKSGKIISPLYASFVIQILKSYAQSQDPFLKDKRNKLLTRKI